jgi:hypothetical protein
VPTNVLPGTAEEPIKIAIIGERSASTTRLMDSLTEDFNSELENFRLGFYEGLLVEFTLVDSPADAIDLLCSSPDTVIFVDGFTYAAAESRCNAQPGFQVEKDGESGQRFEIILNSQLAVSMPIAAGSRRAYCAMSLDDPIGVVYPALAFRAQSLDLFTGFTEIITDFETDDAMMLALQGRYEPGLIPRCAAASLPAGRIDEIVEDLVDEDSETPLTQAQANNFLVVDPTWPAIPYDILVFPPERLFPVYLRDEIAQAINGILEDEGNAADDLFALVDGDGLSPVTEDDYDDFRAWLVSAGWDMAETVFN